MANSCIVIINAAYNNGHGKSSIAAKDVHPLESPQRKLGELSMVLALLQIAPSRCSTPFDTCKTALIYSNVKGK